MKEIEQLIFDEQTAYTICQDQHPKDRKPTRNGFFARMGPFFCDRLVIKELEGPIYSAPNYTWLLVYYREEIVAFSSFRLEKDGTVGWFNQTWVDPDHRRRGIYRRLFELKQQLCLALGVKMLKGTALPESRSLFEEHGWTVTSNRGPRWTWFEKAVEEPGK